MAVLLAAGAGVPALAAGRAQDAAGDQEPRLAIEIAAPVAGSYAQRVQASFYCRGRRVRCTARWRRIGTAAWHPARSGRRLTATARGGYVFRVDARGGGAHLTRSVRFRITTARPPAPSEPRPAPPTPTPAPTPTPTPTPTPSPTPTPVPTPTPTPTPSPTPPPTPTPPPPTSPGNVALTFDDGPGQRPGTADLTRLYVDRLVSLRWPSTFFNVGRQESRYPDLVRHQAASGMATENHSMTHPSGGLTSLKDEQQILDELQNEQEIHDALVPTAETLVRPPEGRYDTRVASAAARLGLTVVTWTLDTKDWVPGTTANQVVEATREAKDQSIVLMHEGYDSTLAALPQIVANLRAKNLCPGRIVPSRTPSRNEWGLQEYVRVESF